jgi:hypothetical protein
MWGISDFCELKSLHSGNSCTFGVIAGTAHATFWDFLKQCCKLLLDNALQVPMKSLTRSLRGFIVVPDVSGQAA